MATYSVSVVVPAEYTVELEADSLEAAKDAAHELDGYDVRDLGELEDFGTPKILEVYEAARA